MRSNCNGATLTAYWHQRHAGALPLLLLFDDRPQDLFAQRHDQPALFRDGNETSRRDHAQPGCRQRANASNEVSRPLCKSTSGWNSSRSARCRSPGAAPVRSRHARSARYSCSRRTAGSCRGPAPWRDTTRCRRASATLRRPCRRADKPPRQCSRSSRRWRRSTEWLAQ